MIGERTIEACEPKPVSEERCEKTALDCVSDGCEWITSLSAHFDVSRRVRDERVDGRRDPKCVEAAVVRAT